MCECVTHRQLVLFTGGSAAGVYEREEGGIIVKQVEEEEGEARRVLQPIDQEQRLPFIHHLQRKIEYYSNASLQIC